MATKRDFYEILGVPRGSSIEEIKKAYLKLARQYHPDVSVNKAQAEEKMKEINEAYSVLSDPKKKQAYDQFGHAAFGQTGGYGQGFGGFAGWPFGPQSGTGRQGPFTYTYSTTGPGGGFEEVDLGDLFGEGGDILEMFFGGGRRSPRRGRDVRYSLTVDFAAAVRGLEREIAVGGKKLKVRVPAGARTGTQLRFAGQGEPGPRGLPAGDLYLQLNVQPHPELVREDDDTFLVEEITFDQAILGDTLRIPVVDPASPAGVGVKELKIPPGTQPDTEFRLRGMGMPRLRGGRGDAYIKIKIVIPKKLTREQREILEKYQRLE